MIARTVGFDELYRPGVSLADLVAMLGLPPGGRLAIVGSKSFARPDALEDARMLVVEVVSLLRPDIVVSGGCAGMDQVARETVAPLGYTTSDNRFEQYTPTIRRWGPPWRIPDQPPRVLLGGRVEGGFLARNWIVVLRSTAVLAVRCRSSSTYGSGWTADTAAEYRKPAAKVLL